MTRNALKKKVFEVIVLCLIFIIIGAFLYYFDANLFQTFRDFILLLVAIPATLLADYFQKRNQFESALRILWSNVLDAFSEAQQYTCRKETTEDQYRAILVKLSKSIDEMRSVYKNLGENKTNIGFYPFETLKIIYQIFEELGFGTMDLEHTKHEREKMFHYWKNFKEAFLWEFDRPEPESFNTFHKYGKPGTNNFKTFKKDV